jgi:hypothetical protein
LAYAKTLAHVGSPFYVPAWRTYVIARDWQARAKDVIGCYPLACLAADSDLEEGLRALHKEAFVSVTLVVDGLLGPSLNLLRRAFSVVRPLKTHYLVDPAYEYRPSKHHRYEIRRAMLRGIEIRIVPLSIILDAWTDLYAGLVSRHHITGVQRFTHESFEVLAAFEALTAVAAFMDGELIACHLWFEHKHHVWSHLAASNEHGYSSGAAYAVYDYSIRHFSGHLINLGGGAGIGEVAGDGLARFKAGFSNRSHTAYMIGSVLDPTTYEALCAARGNATAHDYFPAYRAQSTPGADVAFSQASSTAPD